MSGERTRGDTDRDPADVIVDVRGLEPRLRFDRIMGVYEVLGVGEAMELAVDHDPSCMYYTLKGTRGDEAFEFEYLERGPETWRVRVLKRVADADCARQTPWAGPVRAPEPRAGAAPILAPPDERKSAS